MDPGPPVRLAWVAATEKEAAAMFTGGEPSDLGADEERELSDRTKRRVPLNPHSDQADPAKVEEG